MSGLSQLRGMGNINKSLVRKSRPQERGTVGRERGKRKERGRKEGGKGGRKRVRADERKPAFIPVRDIVSN